jgi:hypothetical protein
MKLVGRGDEIPMFTPSSYVNFSFGIVTAMIAKSRGYPFGTAFTVVSLLHLLYELKDQMFGTASFANSVGDQAVAMIGFCIPYFTDLNPILIVTVALLLYFSPLSSKDGKGGWAFPHTGWNERS